jgi:23S rRNA (uracil1939-C5)-methyltransferase
MPESTGTVLSLRIERMSYGADAIAHTDEGKTVFVSGGAVPDDLVEAEVTRSKDSFVNARFVRVIEPSDKRVAAPCPYADICGGCPWAHLSHEEQLAEKRDNVVNSLVRIGRLEPSRAESLVAQTERPSDDWGYRNKVELALSTTRGRTSVGMHAQDGTTVIKVDRCPLLDTRYQKVVKAVSGALSYLSNSHDLGIERVGIRASRRTKDLEIALWTSPGSFPRAQVAKVLQDATKATSIVRVMTKGPQKARKVTGVERLSGKGCWEERIAGGQMLLSAPSFFQVNTVGAQRLVELVLDGLAPDEDDEAMDLYCGAGTFTLPLARACNYVSAVESYGPAVRDLRRNLEKAQLDNVDAIGGDAGREFPNTDADIIVVDPPRAGLAEDVVRQLSEQPARAIAYVSCDPATLARDIARFEDIGVFSPTRITPVDLFPQTFHVETVTLLSRKDT